jgi:hypothetical protein
VNARGAPKRVRGRHLPDQGSDFGTELWSTWTSPLRSPGPIDSEALPLPADDRIPVHQVQGLSPRGPDSGKHDPKQSVAPLQSGNSLPSLEHSQLLSQSQVPQCQVTALSKSCPNQNSQPAQCLDHGLGCGGNRLNNQYLSS